MRRTVQVQTPESAERTAAEMKQQTREPVAALRTETNPDGNTSGPILLFISHKGSGG